jgi:hypothetical protein
MAYIYTHTRLDKNEVLYVGIGFGNENDKNYKRAYDTKRRNIFWKRIVNKTNYQIDIIEDNLTRESAQEREKYWIKFYGRRDLNEGALANLTNGGDGGDTISNHPRKKSILKRMSELAKGKNNPNYGGKFHTKEYIQKQINSNSKNSHEIIDTLTGEIKTVRSINQAAKYLGVGRSLIYACRNNNWKVRRRYLIKRPLPIP